MEAQEAPCFIQTFFCQMNKRLFFPPQINPILFTMNLCKTCSPSGGGNGKEKKENENGDITAKNRRERLDNEINLPSSLLYRRKHFKKLDVRLFSEEL